MASLERMKTVLSHLIDLKSMSQNGTNANYDPKKILAQERSQLSFDVDELAAFYCGGHDFVNKLDMADLIMQRDLRLMKQREFDIDMPTNRKLTMAQIRRYAEIITKIKDPELVKALKYRIELYDSSFSMRKYVHETLFDETIKVQGTDEQYAKYRDDIKNWNIIGCFAMTELGHSSFLRGLETTATYDKEHQEFILVSPTVTSTKWWIGMAGQTATHTVALAQLYIDGENKGLQWFIVPMRDRNTGELKPGVSAGHLGAKYGRGGLDNGWIQFSSVRIPRENMLARWATVSKEGEYVPPPNLAVSYATLIGERLLAVAGVANFSGMAATIAVRYGLTRVQNKKKIMDFQSHQLLLTPIIAGVYAASTAFNDVFNDWINQLEIDNLTQGSFLEVVQDFHAIAAGLKAWFGWWGCDALETCRRGLGGHGYSAYNNISALIGDYGVITTGGGDNIVLAQQCTRVLIGSLRSYKNGEKLGDSVQYLADESIRQQTGLNVDRKSDFMNAELLLNALMWLSIKKVEDTATSLFTSINNGKTLGQAWDENQMDCVHTSKPHSYYLVASLFEKNIKHSEGSIRDVLSKLSIVFLLSSVESLSGMFLEYGFISPKQIKLLRSALADACSELRPDIIGLVDAFYFPDYIIKSPLGRKDGDTYNNYFKTITSGPHQGVPEYFKEEIYPLTRTDRN
eukprot:TRINITY_DN7105_c0_g1_i1.p1 TRINITY_DN7105_c0_g1~~TRINITY_DN7105_c0_g1_i1.p1  ORF type:complete len:685 (+),score=141.56 TRINITY_DN7105_c0_g1_i1:39-2093(+)